jgi:hypothetical protein
LSLRLRRGPSCAPLPGLAKADLAKAEIEIFLVRAAAARRLHR